MFKNVLVPLDESLYSERALPYAVELCRRFEGRVSLLTAVLPLGDEAELRGAMDFRTRRAETYLQKLAARQEAEGLSVATILRTAEPAQAVADVAREIAADVIVMTTHGTGADRRHAIGGVTQKVLLTAPCPVLLVRIFEETPAFG